MYRHLLWIYRALGVEKGAVERAQGGKSPWALRKGGKSPWALYKWGKSPWALHTADHFCSALLAVVIAIIYIYIYIHSLLSRTYSAQYTYTTQHL